MHSECNQLLVLPLPRLLQNLHCATRDQWVDASGLYWSLTMSMQAMSSIIVNDNFSQRWPRLHQCPFTFFSNKTSATFVVAQMIIQYKWRLNKCQNKRAKHFSICQYVWGPGKAHSNSTSLPGRRRERLVTSNQKGKMLATCWVSLLEFTLLFTPKCLSPIPLGHVWLSYLHMRQNFRCTKWLLQVMPSVECLEVCFQSLGPTSCGSSCTTGIPGFNTHQVAVPGPEKTESIRIWFFVCAFKSWQKNQVVWEIWKVLANIYGAGLLIHGAPVVVVYVLWRWW